MRTTRQIIILIATISLVFISLGCAPVIYSSQDFGSLSAKYARVKTGASEADVLLTCGAPDAVYVGNGHKALVYVTGEGRSVAFGVFTEAKRRDLVVVLGADNKVVGVETIEHGKGSTILGPAETLPMSIDAGYLGIYAKGLLFREPLNYSQEKD